MKKYQSIILVAAIIVIVIVIILLGKKNPSEVIPLPTETTPVVSETTTPSPASEAQKTFTLAEVATHKDGTSCYTVVNGSVYDVTSWISQHPGGSARILSMCGKDATTAFEQKHGGETRPESELASFKIGTLVQ
jgi:cytochrome b involved in lipid metabolism